ncbi:hypothetical protein IE53DRAFT_174657 [Violaceomyces palustris]|uniref:Uncharacterized protein n=1 Tax=Violaceomyces palustris TaxID=1673888 RepID=A0ACD0P5Z3_9BASI|nr:hypothetical protein IE53DRAFT_174657 [Violaceomyces palustris]
MGGGSWRCTSSSLNLAPFLFTLLKGCYHSQRRTYRSGSLVDDGVDSSRTWRIRGFFVCVQLYGQCVAVAGYTLLRHPLLLHVLVRCAIRRRFTSPMPCSIKIPAERICCCDVLGLRS